MKILFNGYNFERKGKQLHYGGPRNFTKRLLNFLDKTPHSYISLVIEGKKEKNERYSLSKSARGKGIFLKLRLRLNTPDVFLAKSKAMPASLNTPIKIIGKIISEQNPDAVLLNGYSIVNWMILRACKNHGIPVAVCHHGLWFKEIQDASSKVTKAAIHIMREMEKDAARFADKEIFLNEFSKKEFNQKLVKTDESRTTIIPLPYNDVFHKPVKRRPGTEVKIGFVGRWDPIKDPLAYLKLAEYAKKAGLPWQFSAVMKIYAEYPALLAKKDAFLQTIQTIEQMKPEKLRHYYAEQSLLVMPSRFDVSPTVVMESLLQNTGTLVSPNVGWSTLYRKLGAEKWIIDFKDPKKVADRIKYLLKAKPPTKLIKYIRTNHSPRKVFSEYIKVLRSIQK